LFFRRDLVAPTADNFARDFGFTSPAFIYTQTALNAALTKLSGDPQVAVYREAWSDSLQISYGSIEVDDALFAKHTYLAVLARLLVWAAFERRPMDVVELPDVLDGLYFRGKGVANLVEEDFFRWHALVLGSEVTRLWVGLSHQLAGYDLHAVREDVLKPLYEQLVDPETRHALGEYYTPDWLATRVVTNVLGNWAYSGGSLPAVLDPACGSGSFLRAVLQHLRGRVTSQKKRLLLLESLCRR
jgi:hypothetical protein